jgi:hypothetical protein
LAGCGYHHGDDSTLHSGTDPNHGLFLDSPVQGLHYQTLTQSGTTDANGSFQYMEDEIITFTMGGIMLGEAPAHSIMTPIDLVPGAMDETHPTVTNMLRFMQTLDVDNDPDNGITLPSHILDELEGRPIHFDMATDEFEHQIDMQQFMDTLHQMDENYASRMMVSIEDAQTHMNDTMINMMNDNMPGNAGDDALNNGGTGGGGMM